MLWERGQPALVFVMQTQKKKPGMPPPKKSEGKV
jgi:hypothetical protein